MSIFKRKAADIIIIDRSEAWRPLARRLGVADEDIAEWWSCVEQFPIIPLAESFVVVLDFTENFVGERA